MRTPTRRVRLAAPLLVVALAACGGAGDDGAEPTGSPTTTTTRPAAPRSPTPDEAFDRELTDQLEGIDATFIAGTRAAGRTLCGNLTALEDPAAEEDPVSELTSEVLIGTVVDGFSQPEVAAVVVRAAAASYCPEHTEVIEEVLTSRGQ